MKLPFTLLSLGLIASLAFVFCSCETESTGGGGALTVSPVSATVPVGGSVTLKARGGDVYSWAIVNSTSNNIGMLSDNDSYTKAAKQEAVEEANLTYHDQNVYDYFEANFPDLFD